MVVPFYADFTRRSQGQEFHHIVNHKLAKIMMSFTVRLYVFIIQTVIAKSYGINYVFKLILKTYRYDILQWFSICIILATTKCKSIMNGITEN